MEAFLEVGSHYNSGWHPIRSFSYSFHHLWTPLSTLAHSSQPYQGPCHPPESQT